MSEYSISSVESHAVYRGIAKLAEFDNKREAVAFLNGYRAGAGESDIADQPTQSEDPSVEAAPDPIEPPTVGYVDIDGFPNEYAGSGSVPNGSDIPEQPTE